MRQCISSTLLPFPPHFSSSTSFLSSPPPFPSSLSLLFLPLLPSSLFLRTSLLLSFTPLFPSSISLLSSPPPFHSSLPLLPFPALFPSSLFLLSFPPPFPSALPFPFFLLSFPPPFPSSLPFLHFPPLFPSCLSVLPFTSIPPFFQVFGGSLHGGDEARQSSSGSLVPRSFQVFGEEWSFVWVLRAQVFGEEWSFGYCERGSGVFSCRPKSNPYYTYRETVDMGETKLSAKRAGQIIAEMSVQWPGVSYDMLGRNCNHFCDELCVKLGVGPIPGGWVHVDMCSMLTLPSPLRSASALPAILQPSFMIKWDNSGRKGDDLDGAELLEPGEERSTMGVCESEGRGEGDWENRESGGG
ncbi:unnamed protein product [Closterium sp. NIES-65]|nr:unnamed protein product [Closterium sp. NIES-65]